MGLLESWESGNRVSEADVSWGRVLGTVSGHLLFKEQKQLIKYEGN